MQSKERKRAELKKAVVLGTFDGVHKGHRAVISSVKDCNITAVTFLYPPKMYFDKSVKALYPPEIKAEALKSLGVEKIEILDFLKVKDISPIDFLNVIKKKYNPDIIACGFNFRFGKNALGSTELLKEFCNSNNTELKISNPVSVGGNVVSSSEIRALIENGEIKQANKLMLFPFSFKAPVIKGKKLGRTLGFPTANQVYPENIVVPRFGVYEVEAIIDNKSHKGVSDIGVKPTVGSDKIQCETYILDYSKNLYSKDLKIVLKSFIRPEMKFSGVEELKNQIKKDVEKIN